MSERWEFWIDVGGTFTDCVGRAPDGSLHRAKVLSSGVTKGRIARCAGLRIVDPLRRRDPVQFWIGARCSLFDTHGKIVASEAVTGFDAAQGTLEFASELPATVGQAYELTTSLEAPLLAIHELLRVPLSQSLPPVSVRLGTTRGTNALLTRRGAKTAFVTTRGFGDILHIGYQNRPRLFELNIRKPTPLFAITVEIDERLAADGQILRPLDESQAHQALRELRQQQIDSLAICLLHAYREPIHELQLERIARELGFTEISLSHRLAPLVKLVARGDTTVVDAYLNPILREYIARLQSSLHPDSDLRLLTSAGGLVTAGGFCGKDSILSGPAGGVVGFSRVAQAAGFTRSIGFDMGGTSTDVARFDGEYELQYETEKTGVRVVSPMLAIHTVAAGGGSLCWFDGLKLCVGPDSAGAQPGPACYGRGGPLCITDCNFYLGKILPEYFPFALDRQAVEERLQTLTEQVAAATGQRYELADLAAGLIRVANANMAQAIRSVSTAQGYNPHDYVLVAFGGAAAQHACAIASELGMRQILNHRDAGLLSAYGMGLADVTHHSVRGLYRSWDNALAAALPGIFAPLIEDATVAVAAQGVDSARITTRRALDLRYRGTDAALTINEPTNGDYAAAFAVEHQRRYGYTHTTKPLEVVAARVVAVGHSSVTAPASTLVTARVKSSTETQAIYLEAAWHAAGLYRRNELLPGDVVQGPAVISELASTTIIDPDWQAAVLSGGELLITRIDENKSRFLSTTISTTLDPVQLEIFNNRFAGIAERMGLTLRNTSSSVNVKERLDFSCALFTANGDLVVNAPHIPVHLGAMSETVKQLLAHHPELHPGDVYVTNDPYRGGSHLPDITVITPVHDAASGELRFFTASRAHHAELGGISPGSMPPFSRTLAEEGVLIRDFQLVDRGQPRWDALAELLGAPPYPSRDIASNLADIAAQVAANQQGVQDLLALVARDTWPVVAAYMQHIQQAASQKVRLALASLSPGTRTCIDYLDDGTPIAVAITITGETATIDFTGSGPVSSGNLNANRAIVTAAVMYVLRLLIAEELPLNQGVLAPVTLVLPEGILNPPAGSTTARSPAVVGGNVETSQRVVDVLLGALGLAAASQGTMNNFLFGDATFGYYETICGGSGATSSADGADAVHTHMTNTRLTDPEVLETRYPVRLRSFTLRKDSGGAGQQRGGDGVVRTIEFLREVRVSLLTQRRGDYAPYGMAGGSPGARGEQTLRHCDGTEQRLASAAQFTAQPGDVLTIATPGGGGWGTAVPPLS